MDKKIIWSDRARADLEEIYLSLDGISSVYAQNWIEEVFQKTDSLQRFPEMGKMLPEREISFLRELFAGNYRIVYSFLNDEITILKIKHTSALLGRI